MQSVFTIVIAIGLAMYYEWKLGLVTACFMPLVLIGIYFQMKVVMGQDSVETQALAASAKVREKDTDKSREIRTKFVYLIYGLSWHHSC